jgi:hypothetical protein
MRRLLILLCAIACLSASGCVMPGDWWPFGGIGGTYNSNTADEASNVRR